MLSLVTKSPLALSKVAPTRLDCCENGPRRQRRRRGVDSNISNRFATYFSNTLSSPRFFCTHLQLQSCLGRCRAKWRSGFPTGDLPQAAGAARCSRRTVALPALSARATRAPCFAHFSANFLPAGWHICTLCRNSSSGPGAV